MINERKRRAASGWGMLFFLLVVLCGESASQPVINTGSLYP